MKIALLTGGGDAPGLNGIIESASRTLLGAGYELVGILDGFEGVLDGRTKPITLDQLVRPVVFRMAGPALGGLLVASGGAGVVFALDSASFVFSAAVLCRVRVDARPERGQARSVARDLSARSRGTSRRRSGSTCTPAAGTRRPWAGT